MTKETEIEYNLQMWVTPCHLTKTPELFLEHVVDFLEFCIKFMAPCKILYSNTPNTF